MSRDSIATAALIQTETLKLNDINQLYPRLLLFAPSVYFTFRAIDDYT